MPLVTHVLWGGLFAACFGASYFVLRISTLVSLACTAIILHRQLTKRGVPSLSAQFCLSELLLVTDRLADEPFVYDRCARHAVDAFAGVDHALKLLRQLNRASFAGWFWLTAIAIVGFLGRQTAALPVLFFASYLILMRRQFRVILWFMMPFALAVYAYYQLSSFDRTSLRNLAAIGRSEHSVEATGVGHSTRANLTHPQFLLIAAAAWSSAAKCASRLGLLECGFAIAILASWCSPSSPFDSSFSDLGAGTRSRTSRVRSTCATRHLFKWASDLLD